MAIKAVGAQAVGAFLNALLSLGLLLVLARQLGPLAFGNYSVLLNAGAIALVVMEGGYPLLMYRETVLASHAFAQWHHRILGIAVGAGLLAGSALAMVPVGPWLGQSYWAWWAVLACMALVGWMNIYSGLLRGQDQFVAEAIWQVAGRICGMTAILLALCLGASSGAEVFVAWALGLALLVGLAGLHKPYRPAWPSFELALPVRQAAWHLMVGQLLFVALVRIDVLALAAMGGDVAQTAHYSAAVRFAVDGALLFARGLNVLQLGFRQRLGQAKDFAAFLRNMAVVAAVFALAGTLFGALAAQWLVALAFGNAYAQAAPLLGWVLGALVLMLPGQVLAQAAIALNRERTVWLAYAVGLAVAWAAAMVFVPGYGALGTAWSMLIGHGCVLLVLVFSLRQHLKPPK